MTVKRIINFLKPGRKKIAIFLLLFLFFPVILPWEYNDCPQTLVESCPVTGCEPCYKPALEISVGWVANAIIDETQRTPQWMTGFLEIRSLPPMWYPEYYFYQAACTYLLACLAIFAWGKFKLRIRKKAA